MALHCRGAVRLDGLVLERCWDETAREQRLVEIPAMDALDLPQKELRNSLDTSDLKAVRLPAYNHREPQGDELMARWPVRE